MTRYRELGLDAPVSVLVREGDDIVGIASEIIDHRSMLRVGNGPVPKLQSKSVMKGYAADVWLANWDAVGLKLDNIVRTDKGWYSVARIDQGGALLMRARAGRKPAAALDKITEWDGFANPQRNPAYAEVVRAARYESPYDLRFQGIRQIEAIEALGKRTDNFARLAPSVNGVDEADVEAIRRMLARRAELLRAQIVPRLRAQKPRRAPKPGTIPQFELDFERQLKSRRNGPAWYATQLRSGKTLVEREVGPGVLTDQEIVALYHYTGSGYRSLTNALHREGYNRVKLPKGAENYKLTLARALSKLPDFRHRGLKRGAPLPQKIQDRYQVGAIVPEFAFTSSSTTRPFSGNTQFIIHSKHGTRVDKMSAFPSENEVLFTAGTRFRVLRRREQGTRVIIEMEEVDQ